MKPSELAAIKEDQRRRNPDGYVTTESKLLAEVERLRGALERIEKFSETDGANYDEVIAIAREALK